MSAAALSRALHKLPQLRSFSTGYSSPLSRCARSVACARFFFPVQRGRHQRPLIFTTCRFHTAMLRCKSELARDTHARRRPNQSACALCADDAIRHGAPAPAPAGCDCLCAAGGNGAPAGSGAACRRGAVVEPLKPHLEDKAAARCVVCAGHATTRARVCRHYGRCMHAIQFPWQLAAWRPPLC